MPSRKKCTLPLSPESREIFLSTKLARQCLSYWRRRPHFRLAPSAEAVEESLVRFQILAIMHRHNSKTVH